MVLGIDDLIFDLRTEDKKRMRSNLYKNGAKEES